MDQSRMPQRVMLKADDFAFVQRRYDLLTVAKRFAKLILKRPDNTRLQEKRWRKFVEFIERKRIKAGLGLIARHLENGNDEFVIYAKVLCNKDAFEIWNHGYDHLRVGYLDDGEVICEFKHTSHQYQLEHLLKAQQLASNKLGIIMHTFGAPENAIDDATREALGSIDELEVWYFGLANSDKFLINRVAEIERPLLHPNFNEFVTRYDEKLPLLALQVHPAAWSDVDFEEFERIIDFLLDRQVKFVNPYEYYKMIQDIQ